MESEKSRVGSRRGRVVRLTIAALAGVVFGAYAMLPAARAGSSGAQTPLAQRPAPASPTVTATVTHNGVLVSWRNVPDNALGFNVFRSDNSAQPLNDDPVLGQSWLDTTAAAGASYTYSVVVASLDDSGQPAASQPDLSAPQGVTTASVGDTLGSATVSLAASFSTSHVPQGALQQSDIPTSLPKWPDVLGSPAQASSVQAPKASPATVPSIALPSNDACSLSELTATVTTLATNATCPSYEIVEDLTVPGGDTLNIAPGTTVFVDDGHSIQVDGTLDVQGTTSSPVVITSADAATAPVDLARPALSAPSPGAWGPIVFDAAPDQAQSQLSYAEISYSSGILSIPAEGSDTGTTVPPSITGGTITNVGGVEPLLGSGLAFVDPSAPVSISGLTYSGLSEPESLLPGNGIAVLSLGPELDVDISSSSVTAGLPLTVVSLPVGEGAPLRAGFRAIPAPHVDAAGNGLIKTDITGNNFTTVSGLPEMALVSLSGIGGAGTSTLTGILSGNNLNGQPLLAGLLLVSAALDSPAPGGTAPVAPSCASGFYAACDDLTMAGDTVTSDGLGVLELTASAGPGSSLTDNAVNGGKYLSSDRSGWVSVDWALGDSPDGDYVPSGDASNLSQYSNLTLTGGGAGLLSRARSADGTGTSSPSISGSSVTGGAGWSGYLPEAVNNAAWGSTPLGGCADEPGAGNAVASPILSADTLTAIGAGLFNVPQSCGGTATADPQISGTTINVSRETESRDGGEGVANWAYARAAGSSAEANPTLSSDKITTPSDDIDNYASSDQGPATADPTVQGSTLTSARDDGIDNWADSARLKGSSGPATADPVFSSTTVTAEDNAIDNGSQAHRGDSAAEASPTVTGSNLSTSNEDTTVYTEADPNGTGAAMVNPSISGSTIINNGDGDGIHLFANPPWNHASGPSSLGGFISGTTITSAWDGIDVESAGRNTTDAPTMFTTTLTNVGLTSGRGDGLVANLKNKGSAISNDPTWNGGTLNAPGGAGIKLKSNGFGQAAGDVIETAPIIDDVPINSFRTGVKLVATDRSAGSGWPGTVHVGGHVDASPITSLDRSGIQAYATCEDCAIPAEVGDVAARAATPASGALVDTSLSGTPVSAYDSAGDFEAYSDAEGAGADVGPSVKGVVPGSPAAWQSLDSTALFSSAYSEEGPAESDLDVSSIHASGEGESEPGVADIANLVYADGGDATNNANIEGNVLDNLWHSSGVPALTDSVYSESGSSFRTGSVSNNQVADMLGSSDGWSDPGGTGIYEYIGRPENVATEFPKLTISGNTVSNVGAKGIWVQTQDEGPTGQTVPATDPSAFAVHVLDNIVSFTGEEGILLDGVYSDVEGNTQSFAGLAGTASGMLLQNENDPGVVSCNAFSGNTVGVQYAGNGTGDPATNFNSFVGSNGSPNLTYNLVTDNAVEPVAVKPKDVRMTNARSNWWGTLDGESIAAGILGNVDSSSPLGGSPIGSPPCGGGGGGAVGGGAGGGSGSPELLPCSSAPSPGTLPSAGNPLVISVAVPGATDCSGVSFTPNNGGTSPSGFNVLGFGSVITAPQASAASPLVLSFSFPEASLPAGMTAANVVVFRDGSPVAACTSNPATTAAPDPCEASATLANGVVTITVLSSHASTWSLSTPSGPGASRLAGSDREGTAIAVSQASFTNGGAGAVVLSQAGDYPDALAGVPLAVAKKAPILLTSPTALDAPVAAEIQRVLPAGGTVYLLGGTSALSDQVASQVTALGYSVVRYGGADRYATAVAIASALGSAKQVLLADGSNFPDALSASAASGSPGTVILLTAGRSVPSATAGFLKANPVPVFAVGGPAAAADPSATGLVGADRYATAVLVAQRFFSAPTAAGLATGLNYPDALTAGPQLARLGVPLLLSDPSSLPASVSAYLAGAKSTLKGIEVLGGTSALSQSVQVAALTAIGG
ncbi:MAG TPA: cell wall-binding repeat-containing protein [Acidimicrobiales bacterium]|nr:cell wall-binding repeat-containing protein [Acidimicrobiales bacterium]